MSASKELKFCRGFLKASMLCFFHKRRRTRLKNDKRRKRLLERAIKRYHGLPIPKEWQ